MRPALKAELDSLVSRLTFLPRQRFANSGTEPGMPRLLWKDGVTSLTDLSEKLKVGTMFTLVVVSLQEESSKFFTLVLGSSRRVNEMRQVFQMLLSYWVWLKRDSYWKRGNKDAITRTDPTLASCTGPRVGKSQDTQTTPRSG
jgi:hypothetical protein